MQGVYVFVKLKYFREDFFWILRSRGVLVPSLGVIFAGFQFLGLCKFEMALGFSMFWFCQGNHN